MSEISDRQYWSDLTYKISHPLPDTLINGKLKKQIPVEQQVDATHDWLKIGLRGSQLYADKTYICTESRYWCSVALLPFGLPADDDVWNTPEQPWIQKRVWIGQEFPINHAII